MLNENVLKVFVKYGNQIRKAFYIKYSNIISSVTIYLLPFIVGEGFLTTYFRLSFIFEPQLLNIISGSNNSVMQSFFIGILILLFSPLVPCFAELMFRGIFYSISLKYNNEVDLRRKILDALLFTIDDLFIKLILFVPSLLCYFNLKYIFNSTFKNSFILNYRITMFVFALFIFVSFLITISSNFKAYISSTNKIKPRKGFISKHLVKNLV